jgi:hypothetical protein
MMGSYLLYVDNMRGRTSSRVFQKTPSLSVCEGTHYMLKHRYIGLLWRRSLFFLLLALLSTGCGSSGAGPGPDTIATSTSSVPTESAIKGPGSANLTATALSTPTPTVCPVIGSVAPASTVGWPIHHDHYLPFQVSVPPNWRAGSTTGATIDGSSTYYSVQVYAPGSTTPFDFHAIIFDLEHFEITIVLSGPETVLADDHTLIPEKTSIKIGNIKTTMYDEPSPICEDVDRIAVYYFGQRQYIFHMKSPPAKARQDLSLF